MQARTAVLLVAIAVSSSSCKQGFGSGFEGAITMHTTSAKGPPADIVVEAKGDKLRFNSDAGYGLYDPSANKVTMVMDAQKAYMDLDFARIGAPQANTTSDNGTIDKTGKHEKVAGIDCEDWTVKNPSGKRSEVCIAQGIAFFDLESLKGGGTALGKELRDKKLFPMRSVEYDASGTETSHMEVTKVEKKSIDDGRFVVPPDYKKLAI
jgi:hypothetical protein